jgi:DNA primase
VYHCFGCQASGDLFTFVQETEGVDFRGALEQLAERHGVELEREEEDAGEAERRRRRERLLELLARTASYYERYLWESSEAARARDYLRGRGLGEEILREFRVGYAPSAWDRVLLASRRGGFTVDELYATGLAQRSRQNGQPYDRFRSRIMFPLADTRGRVLGFGARAMGEDQRPKYLNTSDNDLYHKGLHLYGGDLARAAAARAGVVIVSEGYTDVIALHQAGMRNAVGLMGTALTPEQVAELARMAQTVLLALDADAAGQEAMLRAQALATGRNLELRVVPIPVGTDPAELVQRDGAQAMQAAVDASVPFVRFRVERALDSGDDGTAEGRDRIVEELRPVFATLPPSAMRMELTRIVSSRLALPESLVEQMLGRSPRGGAARGPGEGAAVAGRQREGGRANGSRRPASLSPHEETERAFLALCLASPEDGARALAELDIDDCFAGELTRRAARHLRDGSLSEPMADRPGAMLDADEELKRVLAELVVEAGREEPLPGLLEVQRLQLELARLDRHIRQARGREDAHVRDLAEERDAIKRAFDNAYARVLEETGAREG